MTVILQRSLSIPKHSRFPVLSRTALPGSRYREQHRHGVQAFHAWISRRALWHITCPVSYWFIRRKGTCNEKGCHEQRTHLSDGTLCCLIFLSAVAVPLYDQELQEREGNLHKSLSQGKKHTIGNQSQENHFDGTCFTKQVPCVCRN